MHFDDRLATVLRLRAQGEAGARAQFRQLLDLLGTLPDEAQGPQVDAGYARLAELGRTLPPAARAGIAGDAALRLRSPRLIAALAAGDGALAGPVLARAELNAGQWLDLIPALPPAARAEMRQRRDLPGEVQDLLARLGVRERGLPPAGEAAASAPAPAPAPMPDPEPEPAAIAVPGPAPAVTEPVAAEPEATAPVAPGEVLPPAPAAPREESIGALVKRIEAYRRARQVVDAAPHGDSPRLPLGEDHVLQVPAEVRAFDFATDAAGRIVWADPGVAPMTVGLLLDGAGPGPLGEAMRRRQPLGAQRLTLHGAKAIAGDWRIDALPAFDPLTGRFTGYRGRMRRPAAAAAPAIAPVRDSQADRIRQMLHELRTPVNAIQGFAEVIQQQLFGPTPHEYRALAAGIAGDAARMLAAFEELERLAKLDSGALELDPGEADLAATISATVAQLAAHTRARGSGFALRLAEAPLPVPLAPLEVERIAWRLLATLAGTSAPGEQLKLKLREKDGRVRLDVALPASLARLDEAALFAAAAGSVPQIIAAGVFGVGFALRLVRAEARAAGGKLERRDERLRLELPGLTPGTAGHSEGQARKTA